MDVSASIKKSQTSLGGTMQPKCWCERLLSVSDVTSKKPLSRGIPLKLTKGTLILVITVLIQISWHRLRERLCLICRAGGSYNQYHSFHLFLCDPKAPCRRLWYHVLAWYHFSCERRQIKGLFRLWCIYFPKSFDYIMYTFGFLTFCKSYQNCSISS